MRLKKSAINLTASWLGQFILILVNLVSRRLFINALGEEYLGISGLFTNILSILSLTELGIGSAISYSLYKPLAQNDHATLKAIMNLYKRVYRFIGIIILTLGLLLIPILGNIVPEIRHYDSIYLYYVLFVFNTAISYFYSYKSTLIIANQERYIFSLNHYAWVILLGFLQCVGIVCFKSYLLYLCLQSICTFLENYSISVIADKKFPYLKEKGKTKVEKNILLDIRKNTAALILSRMGTVMVTSTDNILMSKYLSLAVTGIYSSYSYIVSGAGMIVMQIFSAVQASVGNFGVEESVEKREYIYKLIVFVGFVFYAYGALCMNFFSTPFIQAWLGEKYTLEKSTVTLLALTFYLAGMRQASLVFIQGLGLFWYTKWKALIEGVINLFISIVGVKLIGINGIFIGTIISSIVAGWIYEPYVVYIKGFKKSYLRYWILNSRYLLALFLMGTALSIVNQVCVRFHIGFVVLLILDTVLYVLCSIVVWKRTEEFHDAVYRLQGLFSGFMAKRKS